MNNPHQISTIYSVKSYVFYTLTKISLSRCTIAYHCWVVHIIISSNIFIFLLTLCCWKLWDTSIAMCIVMTQCALKLGSFSRKYGPITNHEHICSWLTGRQVYLSAYQSSILQWRHHIEPINVNYFNCDVRISAWPAALSFIIFYFDLI